MQKVIGLQGIYAESNWPAGVSVESNGSAGDICRK